MRIGIFSLGLFLAFACSVLSAQTITEITWIFLNSGPGRAQAKELGEEKLKGMQAQHVGNFGALFDQGKLFAAGPLENGGAIRGIAILAVAKPEDVKPLFKSDPFVQNGILEIEQHQCLMDIMSFGPPKTPFQLDQHTLCIIKKGKAFDASKAQVGSGSIIGLFPSLKREVASGEMICGEFVDPSDKLGVILFSSTNQAQIKREMAGSASIKKDRIELEFYSQFLGRGLFRGPDDQPPKSLKRAKLFDGVSLDGWEGDTQKIWRIENGAFVGGNLNETVPHNDFICTKEQFKNFDLRLKVKLAGTGFVNGGVQIRSQRLTNPAYEMTGYQADMGEGWWGGLYDESRRNKVLAHPYPAITKRIVKQNDWNDYVIRCEGPHIRFWLNGVLTVDYTEPDEKIPMSGLIGLQIHGGGKAEASYKDISIEELPD